MPKRYHYFVAFLLVATGLRAQTESDPIAGSSASNAAAFILTDPKEVLNHVDELIVLEGCICEAALRAQSNGQPLFLNLFDPYPKNLFTVAIWGKDQDKFLSAADYNQKKVRISGRLEKSKNGARPTLSLREAKQITILGDCPK